MQGRRGGERNVTDETGCAVPTLEQRGREKWFYKEFHLVKGNRKGFHVEVSCMLRSR